MKNSPTPNNGYRTSTNTPSRNERGRVGRLSRKARAALGVALVGAGFAAGYLVPHGGGQEAAAAGSRPVATATKAPHHTTAIKHEANHAKPVATPAHEHQNPKPKASTVMTKADMSAPLSPRGGEYDTAEAAVFDAGIYGTQNYAQDTKIVNSLKGPLRAQAQLALQTTEADTIVLNASDNGPLDGPIPSMNNITIPSLRAQTQNALDEAIADTASLDATNEDYTTAQSLISQIHNPQIASQVTLTINQEKAGNDEGALTTWSNIDAASDNDWNNIDTAASSEWNTLYLHTTDYWNDYEAAPDK